MKNNSVLILEIIWIATGTMCIAGAVKTASSTGGSKIYLFLLMAVISFIFAWFRHKQRKKN